MRDESTGRGERQARALVMLVLVIEAIWIFFHKYLPLDAGLWSLQADAVRDHLAGNAHDGLRMVPIPAANILIPLVSGILSFIVNSEVIIRLFAVLFGILFRGFAMLSLLRAMRVREELVYFLVPVFVWSGVFFLGSIPYLAGEAIAISLIAHLLNQDHPREGTFWFLALGFAIVALAHALAFIIVVILVLSVANEQRRSVQISQGWLSNINRVAALIIPGCVILLLRLIYPAPVFLLTSSGFLPEGGSSRLIFSMTPSPIIREAAFPASDIIATAIIITVILLIIASLMRAFLLPMEEVSWQSRSSKGAGSILLLFAIAGIFFTPMGIETSAFFWFAAFLLVAGSYSRGPAVRRGIFDRLLRGIAFIVMIAAGLFNSFGINRGSEAAYDLREQAAKLIRAEVNTAKSEEHLDSLSIRFVTDPELLSSMSNAAIGSFSYSVTSPLYLFGRENLLSNPELYQPTAGMLYRSEKTSYGTSPAQPVSVPNPEAYFDPHLRILAALPEGSNFSLAFGPYAKSFTDTTGVLFDKGSARFRLVIGKLSPKPAGGLAKQ